MKLKKGEIAKKILLAAGASVAVGGLVIGAAVMPGAAKLFTDWYKNQDKHGKYRTRKTFEQLRRERLIDMKEETDGNLKIIITEKGNKKILKYKFEEMEIETPKTWDRKWRMVMFDIPEHLKKARNALRYKLNELGFHQLQKSVWIFPYPCADEINFIIEFFSISEYVRMAEINNFDGDDIVKKEFGI